jgi:hypothetical protein
MGLAAAAAAAEAPAAEAHVVSPMAAAAGEGEGGSAGSGMQGAALSPQPGLLASVGRAALLLLLCSTSGSCWMSAGERPGKLLWRATRWTGGCTCGCEA